MRDTDIAAVGEVAGEALAAGGTLVKDMHEGIAARTFAAVGPLGAPARAIHDRMARAVYGGVRAALRGAADGGAALAAARAPADAPAIARTTGGSLAVAALNGLYGNHLARRGNELALEMAIRRDGEEIPPTAPELLAGFPDASSRVAVFVHGLGETDEAWRLFPLRGRRAGRQTYGERLQEDLGFTPVTLRYNSGLHISEQGRRLAALLDELVDGWPTHVDEIVLVGHSMGGLVARSACHYAELDGRRWCESVRHVFCLGTPHLGADLEKGVNALGAALGRLPETRAFANLLNARSVGIKDLRYGSLVEEDWRERDPDEFLKDRCHEVPFLPDANYYFVAATLSEGPLGSLLGDLLVRTPSASGRGTGTGRRIPFEVDNGRELSGLTHFDLLNH